MLNFTDPYNRAEFLNFLENMLLPDDFEPSGREVRMHYRTVKIRRVEMLGSVQSLGAFASSPLRVYEIEHESEGDPRVTLTRDAFLLLKQESVTRALIVFHSRTSQNYRFSLMRVEYAAQEKRIEARYSNPRRFSFFLGADSKPRTPRMFLCDKGRVRDFEDLAGRFSIEPVNKEFYLHIAHFFNQLVGGSVRQKTKIKEYKRTLELPSVDQSNRHIYQEFVARLIGRIIFIWFLKHKKSSTGVPLVHESLVSSRAVGEGYYHGLLEPLFFEILNTPRAKRAIGERILLPLQSAEAERLNDVPFLNGGLFDPHTDDFYQNKSQYALKIPDQWFKDFFTVLEQYNFTIDENTATDVDIAVDPEMLGRIFENLLAEINPETGETARKATGSYYTPRAIVDYMVDQSLLYYLKGKTALAEKAIADLLSYSSNEDYAQLTNAQKEELLRALDEVKIIDPACGSGAFPMGILQKMLLILQKIDPRSEKWLEKQLAKIPNLAAKREFHEKLKGENWDYVHKLGIIQNAIYGVDIQPIAVEISKLRFFLSLIVDENVNDDKPNRGIEPLPNLEFKFVAANSLIGLPEQRGSQISLSATDDVEQLKRLRNEYLQAYGEDKKRIEREFKETQKKLFEAVLNWKESNHHTQALQLSTWDPFSNKPSAWFDPVWMFGVKGFDIVISNPPYGFRSVLSKEEKHFFRKEKGYQFPSGDSAELFILVSLKTLLNQSGILSFIIPKKSLYGQSWSNVRELWLTHQLLYLMDASKAFANVLLEQISFLIKKNDQQPNKVTIGALNHKTNEIEVFGDFDFQVIFPLNKNAQIYRGVYSQGLMQKIDQNTILDTSDLIKGEIGISNITQYLTFQKNGNAPCVKGIDIIKYGLKQQRYLNAKKANQYADLYKHDKIVAQKIIAHVENPYPHIMITMFYDDQNRLLHDTCVEIKILDNRLEKKFILAYYQSAFCNWYAHNFVYNRAVRTMDFINYYITQIPLPKIILEKPSHQAPFIALVNKILALTDDENYLRNAEKQAKVREYQRQIDALVYELYGLTEEERRVVEGE